MKEVKRLIEGWHVIVGIDMKGRIKFQELFDLRINNIKSKINELDKLRDDLTHFGYKIKKSELL